ncbi:MAG: hypothetical protein A2W99_17550 [Bacteroidetes bacterium GWF2_33_16]|nr:MAG: hypothetical protein A2X00_14690 [Bacteroidetes bacterium GWE2_32_14]OFY06842.1 MAG: hypothetical protein A2W99_17550 [Bacteroidetes bacterium GWF2_33_16]
METYSILIGIGCIALIIAPIFLINLLRKRKKQKLYFKFQAQAKQNNGKINEFEYWNSYAIGIDLQRGTVYYSSMLNKKEEIEKIDVSQIKNCKINNLRNLETDTESLVLEFTFANNIPLNKKIEFYNSEYDGIAMHYEFKLAEKWLKTITICKELLNKK